MIQVRLTGQLRDWTGGKSRVDLKSAADVQSLVRGLDGEFPGIGRRIMDDQEKIRTHVNIFVNAENSRELEQEKTSLRDGDVVYILPSVSGG